jgi:hypothetical protein
MSKHSFHHQKSVIEVVAALALLLATLFFGSATALAQNWYSNAVIYAGSAGGVSPGSQVDIEVYFYEDSTVQQSFGSFNLLITYDPVALTFIGVTQGVLLDSCGWESFQYQEGPLLPDRNAIRIEAIADLDNGSSHPSSYLAGREGPLAKMRFLVSGDSAYLWAAGTPLKFYWNDCLDNTLSSVANDSILYSSEILDWECYPCSLPPTLGTYMGAPDSCLTAGDGRTPARLVSFSHGGVYIWPPDSIDTRGDLNVNGIANEIADCVLLNNYFFEGLSVFGNHVEASVAASDVNADGRTLTYQDLVYLYRIIIGDAQPIGKRAVGANIDAYFHQDSTNQRIVVNCSLPLAGAFMLIKGDVTPTFLIPQVGWMQGAMYDGTYTRILILGDPSQPYSDSIWFTYQGTGELEYVETADWHDTRITAHITNKSSDCGDFNGSGNVDISDVVYVIRYIFSGGFSPIDIHGGDVNCDGSCDISDVVYVLAYIFTGGSAPCENCK